MQLKYVTFLILVLGHLFKANAQLFTQDTGTGGLPNLGYSSGAWGDYNNDGFQDFAICGVDNLSVSHTQIYKNNGNSTFSLVLNLASVKQGTVNWCDINNDGKLDIHLTGFNDTDGRISKIFISKGATFEELSVAMEGVSLSAAQVVDFDNDGDADVCYTGINSSAKKVFKIYRNKGNGTFGEFSTSVPGVSNGSISWQDFNKDGYPDLLLTGILESGAKTTRLYKNIYGKSLKLINTVFDIIAYGAAVWGDYNSDGFPDVIISGINDSGNKVSNIYKNNGNATFTNIAAGLQSLSNSHAAWADYDNDGLLDVLLVGLTSSNGWAYLYKNNGNDTFSPISSNITGVFDGGCYWADFDNSGDLDLLVTGFNNLGAVSRVLYNNANTTDNRPFFPINLIATPKEDSVVLTWSPPSISDETPSAGLTYSIYLGSSSHGINTISPLADTVTGLRRVATSGIQNHNTGFVVKNLPSGKYYWSVQAIDHSLKGSAFALEQSFNICYSVTLGKDTTACSGQTITYGFPPQAGQTINWYRKKGANILNQNSVSIKFTQTDTLVAELINSIGCNLKDTVIINVVNNPKADFTLGKDTVVCYGKKLPLHAGANTDSTNWYSKKRGLLKADTFDYLYLVQETDTLWAEVYKSYGCIYRDTIIVKMNPIPSVDLKDTLVCYKQVLQISSGTSDDQVKWFSKTNNKKLSDSKDLSLAVLKDEVIWVEVTNASGCLVSDTMAIHVLALPEIDAGVDKFICYGTSIQLEGQAKGSNLIYKWTPIVGLSNDKILNPIASPSITTTYYLSATNAMGCGNYDSVTVTVNPSSTIDPGKNVAICLGDKVVLGGNPTAKNSLVKYSYRWFPANSLSSDTVANPIASPSETTQYMVIVRAGNCRPDTARVLITVNPVPPVTISADVSIGFGESTILKASGGEQYDWYTDLNEPVADIAEPEVSPEKTTSYIVIITDAKGCRNTDTVKVVVRNEVFLPNLFSPNGDGKNDSFNVLGSGIKEIVFSIYKRNGVLIYQTNDIEESTTKGWDGTFKGKIQDNGAYHWTIRGKFRNGSDLNFKGKSSGTVNLLR